MQRGGHLIMTELQNDGSRDIRDVVVDVQFLDAQDVLIQSMRWKWRSSKHIHRWLLMIWK